LIALFLEDYPHRVLALTSACDARDAEGVRRVAHTLKGGASNLCAVRVVEAARALESICDRGDFAAIGSHVDRLVADIEHLGVALREFQAAKLRERTASA